MTVNSHRHKAYKHSSFIAEGIFIKLPNYLKYIDLSYLFQIKLKEFLIDCAFYSSDELLNNGSISLLLFLPFLQYLKYLFVSLHSSNYRIYCVC
jgi:hypothetical protein